MNKIIFIIIFLFTYNVYAKSFECFTVEYCPTLNLNFKDNKILNQCMGLNVKNPFEKPILKRKIEVGKNKIILHDLFDNQIVIKEFKRKTKLGSTGFFNSKDGHYLGYLDNYEFNMTISEEFYELQIREFFDDLYRNIYYVNGFCQLAYE